MVRIKWAAFALAAMALVVLALTGCERKITGEVQDLSSANCFGCHNGQIDQQQGEWANSIHASGNNVDYTNRAGGTNDCTKCHDQQGFVQFVTTGTLPSEPFSTVSAIGCFTCHNPHENGNFALRTSGAYTLESGDVFNHGSANLCANCHHARVVGEDITDNFNVTSTHWGPHHGPQGDLINGTGGYEDFPGNPTFPSSPHANQVTNACVGCHMGSALAHDGYKIGGHSFNMVDEETGTTLVGICANASCHPGVNTFDFTADADYDHNGVTEGYQTELMGLHDSLGVLLTNAGVLSGGSPVVGTIADGHTAGALFNYLMIEEDRSEGVHNFNYMRSLLDASIAYLNTPAAVAGDGSGTVKMASSH